MRSTRVVGNAQQREGEYSPSKIRSTPTTSKPARCAQQREGEYSPSKAGVGVEDARHDGRSTKGGGIFPLQVVAEGADVLVWPRSTKGGGIFPLQARFQAETLVVTRRAQQREGEYSPSKVQHRGTPSRQRTRAQQREGEYSPSKRRRSAVDVRGDRRSTKGGGIFPLQVSATRSRFGALMTAQQREGEYSPSKSTPAACVCCRSTALNKGRGNIPPPSGRRWLGRRRRRWALNKGRGNIPPPSLHVDEMREAARLHAQQREGEYSPSKAVARLPRLDVVVARSTKGGGIFPLQASQPQSVAKRSVRGQG